MAETEAAPQTRSERGFEAAPGSRSLHPFLFLVLQSSFPLRGGTRYLLTGVREILIGRGSERSLDRSGAASRQRLAIAINCPSMSSRHAKLEWTREGWAISDLGSRNGVHVNGRRVEAGTVISDGDIVTLGGSFFVLGHFESRSPSDIDYEDVTGVPPGLLTLQPTYGEVLADLQKLAPTRAAICLVGETGTGKEVLARAIHHLSGRRGPYTAFSCADIPSTLIASELFGHVKGAFSGATHDRPGHIREAHQGTVLLDEILAAPPELQAALLRVLQEKQLMPVGGKHPVAVDVRFLSAAQQPLDQAVAARTFRADLQARLEGFVCRLPPLRERICDIGNIVALTLRGLGIGEGDGVVFTLPAALALLRADWSLNIRALVDAVSRARYLATGSTIDETHLPRIPTSSGEDQLKNKLLAELKLMKGNVAETARRLGRNRTLVHKWLRKIGVDPARFR